MKQVDVKVEDPVTGKKTAFEIVTSTFDTEPDQALRDLAEGAGAVVHVAANRGDLEKLEQVFMKHFGAKVDPRIKLAMPCHLAAMPSLEHLLACPTLVYDPKWDKIKVKTSARRS